MIPHQAAFFEVPPLNDAEFKFVQKFIADSAGIVLSNEKKALVSGRLGKRLRVHSLASFSQYFKMVQVNSTERQIALDLLTTNETYFFREPQHFEFLRNVILPEAAASGAIGPRPFRIWSAASSSGEEAYSAAMVLDDTLRDAPWEIIGSDISTQMLERCRKARYPMERTDHIPPAYLRTYCWKGVGIEDGFLRVDRRLRQKVQFLHGNLNGDLPAVGKFDVIFLRNVMIYFDAETKRKLLIRMADYLNPGGWFIVSHTESLHGLVNGALTQVKPSIYRKPA
jgi:chemotaxis protein methyltransferase CheR